MSEKEYLDLKKFPWIVEREKEHFIATRNALKVEVKPHGSVWLLLFSYNELGRDWIPKASWFYSKRGHALQHLGLLTRYSLSKPSFPMIPAHRDYPVYPRS